MLKETHIWLLPYLARAIGRRPVKRPTHLLFCFVDHFEPAQRPNDPPELQLERVNGWIEGYESRYRGHTDRFGRPPQHTYFFPQEQYDHALLGPLARHCGRGFGEVEIHIHHDDETPERFVEKIEEFKERLAGHGLLCRDDRDGRIKYGFIHGNWALDNSRRDGRWCGLNNEITLLRDTGCYADFTMPSAPADCQTRKVNSIYFADDDPARPKSHYTGRDVRFGGKATGDLLLVQGPLALNWRSRSRGLFPRIENSDISSYSPFTPDRIRLWVRQRICVAGRDDVVFMKVHTHGMKERHTDYLLGPEAERGFEVLERSYDEGSRFILHYVTAREMANIILAYNDGVDKPPQELLDYTLKPLSGREFPR